MENENIETENVETKEIKHGNEKGIDYLKRHLKEEVVDKASVIAVIKKENGESSWYHVHKDEKIPISKDVIICISIDE